MIWDFVDVFSKVRDKQKLFADDAVDKLNRSTTIILAIIVAIFIGVKNLGESIKCIDETVTHVKISMDYVNALCFAKDTYTLANFTGKNRDMSQPQSYYPWLPLISLCMGLSFYVPYLVWKSFIRRNSYRHMPVDITGIIALLRKSCIYKRRDFNKDIILASEYLDRCFSLNNYRDAYVSAAAMDDDEMSVLAACHDKQRLTGNRDPIRYRDRQNVRRLRFHVPLMFKYLFVKLLYVCNSVCIFFVSTQLLQMQDGTTFFDFGVRLFAQYVKVYNATINSDKMKYLDYKYFPRVVFCDVHVRADFRGNVNQQQYQCTLPANVFNEKAFIVLWVWFLALFVINLCSAISWLFSYTNRKSIIREMIEWPTIGDYPVDDYIDGFVYETLSTEGFLVIMLVKSNTNDWYCREIVRMLWRLYLKRSLSCNEHIGGHIGGHNEDFKYGEPINHGLNANNNSNEPPTEKVGFRRQFEHMVDEASTVVNQTPRCKGLSLNVNNNKNNDIMQLSKLENV